MRAEGILVKMPVRLANGDGGIEYTLRLESARSGAGSEPDDVTELGLNRYVGRPVRLEHTGDFTCIRCGRAVDKLFGEGVIVALLILRCDEHTQGVIELVWFVELPLIEKLHRSHAVFTALRTAFNWF